MLRTLSIKNYKSILDHTIELGRINVFIGENGCGKTNILEAVAMAGAAMTDKLGAEELFIRGIRVARPSIMRSSFPGSERQDIELECGFVESDDAPTVKLKIKSDDSSADRHWFRVIDLYPFKLQQDPWDNGADSVLNAILKRHAPNDSAQHVLDLLSNLLAPHRLDSLIQHLRIENTDGRRTIGDFGIYNASALALRGLETFSRRTPIGLHGEALDVAIASLPAEVWQDVVERARCISWLDDVVVDPTDQLKYQGHKPGKSVSTLYFHDRHMHPENNIFSAENVNEGILHILFHLTLFVSASTPKVLGIDNIDTALNPQLCRDLMKQLAELAVKHDKQALITTHNPAILDGLNLHDDDQRLFVVYRDDDGHTLTRRIKAKPQPDGQSLKLSELWMRGHLGVIPRNF
ncbi:MAG: AAA family ATPase [Myxococcales bacterium]|nr:AAA family ATPase [Myxococcales bacterium]